MAETDGRVRARVEVRPLGAQDVEAARGIWNEVVRDGVAFPQVDELASAEEAQVFFGAQTLTSVAADAAGRVLGLYILHPNNVGRCAHVANASFAVSAEARGLGVGRALVGDALAQLGPHGFTGLQFNAVVDGNRAARHLYEDMGFTHVGVIPRGFLTAAGAYEDIHIYYHDAL